MAHYTGHVSVPYSTYDIFRDAVNGNWYDWDGFYGAQCWDGVQLLYGQVGQILYTGPNSRASECWTVASSRIRNGSGHFSIVEGKTNIKKGDVIVFNRNTGWTHSAGHIGFANEDYNGTNTISLLSQNYENPSAVNGSPFSIDDVDLTPFLGIFRFDEWQGTPPTPPTPTEEKRKKEFPWPVAWSHWDNFKI